MQEYLNENTLYATLAMYLSESDSLLLVVEGPDDHLMLKNHCSPELRLIAGTGGRGQVLRTAELALKRNLRRVRFLVDRDYDHFTETACINLENVFVSEEHDCFLDVSTSEPALLTRVIEVHTASARRRPGMGGSIPDPEQIRADSIALAAHLVAVRVVDARRNLSLDFKKFSFGGLNVSQFDVSAIAEIILTRSEYSGDDAEEIIKEAIQTHAEVTALPQVPVGDHDLFSAVARILKRFKVAVSDDVLQRGFILAVSCSALSRTRWFRSIQDWCASESRVGFTCQSDTALAA